MPCLWRHLDHQPHAQASSLYMREEGGDVMERLGMGEGGGERWGEGGEGNDNK